MERFPVSVTLATRAERREIAQWLCDKTIYEDAFLLAAPPDAAWIEESMLLVKNNRRIEFQEVRFWSIREGASPSDTPLLGFAVDYGWDKADDTEREIDYALPRARGKNPRLAVYVLSLLLDRLFREEGATAAYGRIPLRSTREGLPRLFAAIGAAAVDVSWTLQPTTQVRVARVAYRTTPQEFYASRLGRRVRQEATKLPIVKPPQEQ